jgi:hypothetical protein
MTFTMIVVTQEQWDQQKFGIAQNVGCEQFYIRRNSNRQKIEITICTAFLYPFGHMLLQRDRYGM